MIQIISQTPEILTYEYTITYRLGKGPKFSQKGGYGSAWHEFQQNIQ